MNKLLFRLLLWLLVPAALQAQSLRPDSSFRTGKLANGLTYYIRHNAKEAGIADFYLAQRVGSILEEPRQRGLAHFLEHMAFNGTQHFRGDGKSPGIVPWCESIGVRFGTNLNAYTSVDETVYNVSAVPVKRETVLDSVLLILHDWSHSLLLTDKEIDKERGVIQEEWRTRRARMATQRMMEQALPKVYGGTRYADCLPIGSMDIVKSFPYNDLRDYYHKWYRPDLQAVVVVGDVDVDRVERKIRQLFGSIPLPKERAERIYYPVPDNRELIVAVEKDSEQPIMLAHLYMKHAATPDAEKQNAAYLRANYIDRLITSMLNGRLSELKLQPEPPFLSATAHAGTFLVSRTKDAFSLSFGCRQENVAGSFGAVIGEAERARRFGFTLVELQRAKAVYLKSAERRAAEQNDRRNNYFVNKAVSHFLSAEPLLSDADMLNLYRNFDEEVTLDEVNEATRRLISDSNQVLTVYAPDKSGFVLPSEQQLRSYVAAAQQATYEAYKEPALPTLESLVAASLSQNTKRGKAAKPAPVGSYTDVGQGVKLLSLPNGVKVYVKPTDFAKDQVSMRFFGNKGTQLYPDADVPNFSFVSSVITASGVATVSEPTLRKMLAGKAVRVQPSVGDDEQSITGSASAKDIRALLQLTYLYFTCPRTDSIAFSSQINSMRSFLTNREANPQVAYNDSLACIAYGDSPRMQPVKRATLDRVSHDRIMQIYRDQFGDANGFKMILTGNVDLDSLRQLLQEYVATLPSSAPGSPIAITRHPTPAIQHPSPNVVGGTSAHVFRKKMNTPSALVTVLYTFPQPFTTKADLALDAFRRVLTIAYTDSVREEKGGTYGVSVQAELDKDSNPTALVKVNFRTDPSKYAELMPVVYRQIAHIADKGPEPSSMNKVKSYLAKAYGQNVITNGYWDYVVYNRLRNGIDFDTDYLQQLDSLQAADVQQVARDLINSKRRIEVTMLPE